MNSLSRHRVWHRKKQHHLKEKARKELEAAMEEQRRLRVLQLERTKEPVNIDYDPSSVVAETHVSYSHKRLKLGSII